MLKKTNKHPSEGRIRGRHHRNPLPRPTTEQPAPRPTTHPTKSRDPNRPTHPRRPDTLPQPAPKERSRSPRGCRPRSEQTKRATEKRRKQPPRQKPMETEGQPRRELIYSNKYTKKRKTAQEKSKKNRIPSEKKISPTSPTHGERPAEANINTGSPFSPIERRAPERAVSGTPAARRATDGTGAE